MIDIVTPESLSAISNHEQYLARMSASSFFSTKQNIPPIIKSYGCKTVLDVGCADGSFTHRIACESQTIVTGIDINEKNIDLAKKNHPEYAFVCSDLKNLNNRVIEIDKKPLTFDCIVFSSVLHEISSYDPDEKKRFTSKPIREAIELAAKHLNPNGILIIRDGLKATSAFGFSAGDDFFAPEYRDLFHKFVDEFPPLKRGEELYPYNSPLSLHNGQFLYHEEIFMEFLMLATWGEESWSREINERKFICNRGEWYNILFKNGFNVNSFTATNEEYPRYCRKFLNNPYVWTMPSTTCLIVAQKKN